MNNPTQRLLPFDRVVVETISPTPRPARYEPSDEALAVFEELEGWLLDARGRPASQAAEETLFALTRALLEGKNGWFHAAEAALEALRLRNGRMQGPDIPTGAKAEEGEDLQQAIDHCLDALHQRFVAPTIRVAHNSR